MNSYFYTKKIRSTNRSVKANLPTLGFPSLAVLEELWLMFYSQICRHFCLAPSAQVTNVFSIILLRSAEFSLQTSEY